MRKGCHPHVFQRVRKSLRVSRLAECQKKRVWKRLNWLGLREGVDRRGATRWGTWQSIARWGCRVNTYLWDGTHSNGRSKRRRRRGGHEVVSKKDEIVVVVWALVESKPAPFNS
jgi:hypothetical protein